ncbi:hypothetical protein D3880_15800 [Pseudomonas cavernae]|uniref:Uncharacterized protein n=2 Tax=Pseudomonas cavernae TaxID=2320867 RepID=A0A385Z6N6_9PSED|nr:hypothetical protein [Pseudomonas cavernae]AYC33727.1 hypothetical protein D3880_15800 [Pseudomonas cavernae]
MTSKPSPDHSLEAQAAETPALDTSAAVESSAATTAEPAPATKSTIPTFAFPFSPATFAPGKNDNQPWHQKGNKSGHEKKIGPAPNGTRRSMGKR